MPSRKESVYVKVGRADHLVLQFPFLIRGVDERRDKHDVHLGEDTNGLQIHVIRWILCSLVRITNASADFARNVRQPHGGMTLDRHRAHLLRRSGTVRVKIVHLFDAGCHQAIERKLVNRVRIGKRRPVEDAVGESTLDEPAAHHGGKVHVSRVHEFEHRLARQGTHSEHHMVSLD